MSVIYINHSQSQCGVYEIGKRIYELLDKSRLSLINNLQYTNKKYMSEIHKDKENTNKINNSSKMEFKI